MDFEHSEKVKGLTGRLSAFMASEIYPLEAERHRWVTDPANLWVPWPEGEKIKAKARSAGLWNLFLPHEYGAISPGLTNLEYAPLAELMGRGYEDAYRQFVEPVVGASGERVGQGAV